MSDDAAAENWVLGVTLGILGSVWVTPVFRVFFAKCSNSHLRMLLLFSAINVGNNIQSLGLKQLHHNRIESNAPIDTVVARRGANDSLPSLKLQSPPIGRLWPRSPLRTAPVDANEEEFIVVPTEKRQPIQSPTWVLGTVIFVSGSLLVSRHRFLETGSLRPWDPHASPLLACHCLRVAFPSHVSLSLVCLQELCFLRVRGPIHVGFPRVGPVCH